MKKFDFVAAILAATLGGSNVVADDCFGLAHIRCCSLTPWAQPIVCGSGEDLKICYAHILQNEFVDDVVSASAGWSSSQMPIVGSVPCEFYAPYCYQYSLPPSCANSDISTLVWCINYTFPSGGQDCP